jgi:UDP-N-acetylmuramoyl-tripeptide--D-alanyl-D-alanine ligase
MKWLASELARALTEWSLTAETSFLFGPDVEITGAHFDSREIVPGQMFFPLVADRDGHDFVEQALQAGALAYVTSRRDVIDRVGGTAIVVPDTAIALRDAATWVRTKLSVSTVTVGITGSVGKTSTKDFAAAALGSVRKVAANERSFNNEQGLPITILNAPLDTDVLVLEMGMRGFGQIADLCRIARPAIGVVTSIGEAHTELVGGIEGVAQAKGELIEALPPQGVAILNADDMRVRALSSRSVAPVLTYGEDPDADVWISDVRFDDTGCARAVVTASGESVEVVLSVPGRHMMSNAAAALAIGVAIGVPLEPMARALSQTQLSAHRMQLIQARSGALLLDDCYNANPTSMSAALGTLASLDAVRRVAILGVMAELADPESAHRAIAEQARRDGIRVLAVGTDLYGTEAVSIEAAIDEVGEMGPDTAVLIKGSRIAQLERVVDGVTD